MTTQIVPPTRPTPQTAGAIRARIHTLRNLYGQVLDLWPSYAVAEYDRLSRQLRRIEATPITGVKR